MPVEVLFSSLFSSVFPHVGVLIGTSSSRSCCDWTEEREDGKPERRNLKRQSVGPSLLILGTANNPSLMFWMGDDKK